MIDVTPTVRFEPKCGGRVYARSAVRYRGAHVIHKGGRGTVVHVLDGVPYVRWDWTGDTYPAHVWQLGRLRA